MGFDGATVMILVLLLLAVVLVLALMYIGLTLLADLLNAVLDPRLRTA